MIKEDTVVAFKLLYTLVWIFLASYYFSWGGNETTVTAPIDESGWVPDGALANLVAQGSGGGTFQEMAEE